MTENALNAYAQAQGISTTVSKMSEQEKVALRYQFVLQQLNFAQGDFANTSNSMANQLRLLSLNFESFKATIGQGLINIFLPVIKVLNAVIVRLQVFAQYFSAITGALFGKAQAGATSTAKATSGLGSSLGSLGNSSNNTSNALKKATNATKNTGTAAKKAKKEIGGLIGGLDEINNLSSNSTAGTSGTGSSSPSSTGTGGIGALGDIGGLGDLDLGAGIDTSGIEAKAEKIAQIFTNMKNAIIRNKDAIISVIAGLVAGIGSYFVLSRWSTISTVVGGTILKLITPIKRIIETFIAMKRFGITPILKGLLGINPVFVAIAVAIGVVVGALTYLWRTDSEFKNEVLSTWKAIKDAMKPFLDALKILLPIIGDIIKTVLVTAFKLLAKVILAIVKGAGIVFLRLLKAYTPIIKAIGKAFLKFAKDVQRDVKKIKNFNIKKWLDKKKQEVKDGLKVITTYFSNLGKDIQKKWDEALELVGSFIINIGSTVEDFKDKVVEKWDATKDWIKDKVLEIGAKVADFYRVVQDKLNEAKNWLKDKALEIMAKVGSFYNMARDNFNTAKNNIKNWFLEVRAKVRSFYDQAKTGFNTAKNNIKNWYLEVKAKVGSFYDKVKTAYNSAKNSIKSWAFSIALKVNASANSVRGVINGVIRQINNAVMGKIKFTVPSWVPAFGGKTWRAPTIPYLAKGGLIDSPTLAMVGERGSEVVLPIENNTGALNILADKIQSRMSTGNISSTFGGSTSSNNQKQEVYNGDVVIKLDGNTVFRQSVVSILRQMKRQGITI